MAATVPLDGIDRVLCSLYEPRAIAANGEARLVVGPTGAFVVMPGNIDVRGAAQRAHELAAQTRDALAEHLSWVPFVDAVVVCDRCSQGDQVAATVVPFDLLPDVLREGMKVIDEELLVAVRELICSDRLTAWRAGPPVRDARIDLCEPQVQQSIATPAPD